MRLDLDSIREETTGKQFHAIVKAPTRYQTLVVVIWLAAIYRSRAFAADGRCFVAVLQDERSRVGTALYWFTAVGGAVIAILMTVYPQRFQKRAYEFEVEWRARLLATRIVGLISLLLCSYAVWRGIQLVWW